MAVLPPKRPFNKPPVDDPLKPLLEPPPINPARLPRPPRPELPVGPDPLPPPISPARLDKPLRLDPVDPKPDNPAKASKN